jgi:ribosomal protein S18 acetylase RimI-like enzyme
MQKHTSDQVIVESPDSARREMALTALLGSLREENGGGQIDASWVAACQDASSFDGLFEARRGSRAVGAVWGRLRAGGSAEVLPLWLRPGEEEETARRLLTRLDAYLLASGVRVAFACLPKDERQSARLLAEQGYQQVADMLVMARTTEDVPEFPSHGPPSFCRYQSRDQQRLVEALERTYVDTLDFPLFNGLQDTPDVLARHADVGDSGKDHWWFVRESSRDVGCLLLADHSQQDRCELVYMGIAPDFRGQGWGRRIVDFALSAARAIGRRQMILGVDAENDPAIAVYTSADFLVAGRKAILFKAF